MTDAFEFPIQAAHDAKDAVVAAAEAKKRFEEDVWVEGFAGDFVVAVLEAALPHLRVQETPDAEACDHDWREYWDGSLGYGATDSCTRCDAYRPTPETRSVVDREVLRDHIAEPPCGRWTPDGCVTPNGCECEAETKALAETATELGRRVGRKEAGEEIATAFLNYMTNDILGRADISVDRAVAMVREITKRDGS